MDFNYQFHVVHGLNRGYMDGISISPMETHARIKDTSQSCTVTMDRNPYYEASNVKLNEAKGL